MVQFQQAVLVVAIIALVISLIVIGMLLSKGSSGSGEGGTWPPTLAYCPDYWVDLSDENNGSKCYNQKSLGKCNLPSANDKNTKDFSSMTSCQKYEWAQACGVVWDGLDSSVCVETVPSS